MYETVLSLPAIFGTLLVSNITDKKKKTHAHQQQQQNYHWNFIFYMALTYSFPSFLFYIVVHSWYVHQQPEKGQRAIWR